MCSNTVDVWCVVCGFIIQDEMRAYYFFRLNQSLLNLIKLHLNELEALINK